LSFWQAPEVRLAVWGFGLNAVWEAGQSPLYTDSDRSWDYLVWSRVHCTVGDVLILLAAFWVVSLLFRTRSWAIRGGFAAAAIFVGLGFAYTGWSEIYNTQIARTWTYSPEMPQIAGIGLAPLLQWLLILPALVLLLRRTKLKPGGKT
jgi:hypothetical protein